MANKLVLLFLLCILSSVFAQEVINALSGQQVDLECDLNSTKGVTWYIDVGGDIRFIEIYKCEHTTDSCTESIKTGLSNLYKDHNFTVSRSKNISYLSLIPQENKSFKCKLGAVDVKIYDIFVFDDRNIKEYCYYSPSISKSEDYYIALSCGYTFQGAHYLNADLTFDGFGLNNIDVQISSQSINGTLSLDDNFDNIYGARCVIDFLDIGVMKSCAFPNITEISYSVKENDAIFGCDYKSEVNWHLIGRDGIEEDISNRSWTRDGGRSLLIRGISEEDVGKLVVWRTKENDGKTNNSIIGFTVISDISGGSINNPDSKDPNTAPSGDDGPFFVLTLLFLALWLITIVVGGIVLFCREEKCKSSLSDIPSTSVNARSPNSNQSSNVRPNGNVGCGENGTPVVRFTTEATNPDVSNTNNSAHTPVLERDDGNDDTLNRKSQGNSHLYFTLEKSPSASFRRATAPRWNPGDANSATLDQERDSLWQGYATVGESNENATCSYDIGEYAEVGEHLLGKGPPVQSTRPPVRKKPGREEVKEDDISKLYGKVNK